MVLYEKLLQAIDDALTYRTHGKLEELKRVREQIKENTLDLKLEDYPKLFGPLRSQK